MAVRSGQTTANTHEEVVSWMREALNGVVTPENCLSTGIYYGMNQFHGYYLYEDGTQESSEEV